MPPALEVKQRPLIGAMFKGPGPCYMLPSTVGYVRHDSSKLQAPAFTFGLKSPRKEDSFGPGPSAYVVPDRLTRHGVDGTAKYSLHYRTKDFLSFRTPGPDAYGVELVKVLKQKTPPAYSFGLRTPHHKKESAPAPNAYTLPNMLGSKVPAKSAPPCFSISGRPKVGSFDEDFAKTPGPCAYKVCELNNWKCKAPVYTVGGRHLMIGDTTTKPAPNSYKSEQVFVNKRIPPKFSFGVRHSEYTAPLLFALE